MIFLIAPILAAAAPRIAIIPLADAHADAAAILIPALSQITDVELVEREALQSVLAEQRLSAENDQLMKLGKLLRADGLLLIESSRGAPAERRLQARLLAVGPGVNLSVVDSAWPVDDVNAWQHLVLRHFGPYWSKLTTPPERMIRVSLMSLRSAVESPAANALDRE
ncbi:MAG TPA: hypothetical protein DCY13_05100, partial [Verrucomicrobiales bacterium]|nr:hypothetical protein [Verrucomicrobiales bacterium]